MGFFPDTRSSNPGSSRALENFKIAHIGSLYGSRNLDNFFKALDEIYLDDSSTRGFVKIVNKGGLYLDQKEKYLQRVDFIHEDLTNRVDGLKLAKGVDSLLLVQHTDKRSYQTIPYKLYDYLNLGRPIIAITSNLELEELLRSYGAYIADSRSISSIKSTLLAVFNDVKKNRLIHPEPTSKLDIREQFNKIFSK